MSSYRTETSTGLPILYLQNHKKALWEKFHERYPNGMQRTSFMTRLQGGRYIYKDNLGGICSTCNELGYEVFEEIEKLLKLHISNIDLQVRRQNIHISLYIIYTHIHI